MTNRQRTGVGIAVSLAIVLAAFSGSTVAANSGSLVAEPRAGGELATHTMTVTVEQSSAGSWNGIALDYSDSGANPAQVTAAGIATLGIDRGDDDPADSIDIDASGDVESIAAENTGQLVIRLGGAHDLEAGDEIVLRIVRSIQNPASDDDYVVPIDVNPDTPGGETTAKLQIGTDRATVLVDDQTVTGTTVSVDSVRLPKGGFVVLHDMETLDNGASNADAVTGASVVGVSSYLSAGQHEGVTVQVDDVDVGSTGPYAAMVTKDDGDEAFDAEVDRPYTINGNPIWESAAVTFREPTATATPERTPTPEETATSTPTDVATEPRDSATPTSASGPGFGGLLATIAILASVVARQRR